VYCRRPGEGGLLDVVGIGEAEARGLRKGVIVNPDAAVDQSRKQLKKRSEWWTEAEEVTINLAGSHILGFNGQAIVAVIWSRREIVTEDVRRAIDSACAIPVTCRSEIVDRLPQEFIVDDQDGINDPVGMIGARLAVKVHIVTSPVDCSSECNQCRQSCWFGGS
jgi:cell division protein FtsA